MTVAVNLSNLQAFRSDERGAPMGRVQQRSSEVLSFSVDYSGWLPAGETVSSVVYLITPTTAPALQESNTSVSGGNKALFQMSGGLDGALYTVLVTASTSGGQTKADVFYVQVGAVATSPSALGAYVSLGALAVGALYDGVHQFFVKLAAPLFQAPTPAEGGSGDVQLTLNKASVSNIASVRYQDSAVSKAEAGLISDDHYHVRVSQLGSVWLDSIRINVATGVVSFPQGIDVSLIAGAITPYTAPAHEFLTAVSAGGLYSSAQPAFTDLSGTLTASQLPNPSATTLGGVKSLAAVATKFLTSIGTDGLPVAAQPAFTDLSGTLTASQLPNPSATTLGGVKSLTAVATKFLTSIGTDGLPVAAQPAFTDISGTVAVGQFGANVITYAKIQQVAASSLIGNPTGGAADAAGVTLGATLAFAASVLQTGAGTGDVTWSANSFATTIAAGVVTYAKMASAAIASSANYLANAASVFLTPNAVWSAAAPVTLTDAATVAVDMSTFINAKVTLGGNRTLGNPTNVKEGQSGVIEILQDGTGSRTLSYASNWKFIGGQAPTLTTTASARDVLTYYCISATVIMASLSRAVA